MTRPFLTLAVATSIIALASSPAAAFTPVFGKICGVDGEADPAPAPGEVARPDKPGKPAKPGKRNVATPPRGGQPDIIVGSGAGGLPDRPVAKPKPKPNGALLIPGLQKPRG